MTKRIRKNHVRVRREKNVKRWRKNQPQPTSSNTAKTPSDNRLRQPKYISRNSPASRGFVCRMAVMMPAPTSV